MLHFRYKLKHRRSLSAFITTVKSNMKFEVSRGGLIVSYGLGSSLGWGHCFEFMGVLMRSSAFHVEVNLAMG